MNKIERGETRRMLNKLKDVISDSTGVDRKEITDEFLLNNIREQFTKRCVETHGLPKEESEKYVSNFMASFEEDLKMNDQVERLIESDNSLTDDHLDLDSIKRKLLDIISDITTIIENKEDVKHDISFLVKDPSAPTIEEREKIITLFGELIHQLVGESERFEDHAKLCMLYTMIDNTQRKSKTPKPSILNDILSGMKDIICAYLDNSHSKYIPESKQLEYIFKKLDALF